MTNEINGQVAIGWLVMEDLMSVVLLVCLPPFAQAVQGADVSLSAVAWKVATTLIWAAVFVVLMLVACHGVGQTVDSHFGSHYFQRFCNKKSIENRSFRRFLELVG